MMIEYYNLSRGLLCGPPADARYMRLQSTWCEQKRWEDVLWTTPPDLYYHLALGRTVVVHDQSERPRQTRAQWQGLSWIRFVCGVTWYQSAPAEFSRQGMNITPYWMDEYDKVSGRVVKYVERFAGWATGQPVLLAPCLCRFTREGRAKAWAA